MVAFKSAWAAADFALDVQMELYSMEWPEDVDLVYRELQAEALEATKKESASSLTAGPIGAAVAGDWMDDELYQKRWNGLRVRVGMHFGVGSVTYDRVSRGYDYYGTVVNTAARVEGVGHGGQVLATKDMFDELSRVKYDFSRVLVTPLGPQPLRGLTNPVPLYQMLPLVGALAERRFPMLRLDIELDVDEESESSAKPDNTTSSHTSSGFDSESFLQKLLRRSKTPQLAEKIVRAQSFLLTVFSTASESWQKNTVKELLRCWKVKPSSGSGSGGNAKALEAMNFLLLCHRAVLAEEEAYNLRRQFFGESPQQRALPSSRRMSLGPDLFNQVAAYRADPTCSARKAESTSNSVDNCD